MHVDSSEFREKQDSPDRPDDAGRIAHDDGEEEAAQEGDDKTHRATDAHSDKGRAMTVKGGDPAGEAHEDGRRGPDDGPVHLVACDPAKET